MSRKKGTRLKRVPEELFLAEGHAVSALVHGGVTLMGTYQNAVQSAVVSILTVVSALMNSTLNALVCLVIHNQFLLFRDGISMYSVSDFIQHNDFEHGNKLGEGFFPYRLTFSPLTIIISAENMKTEYRFYKERKICHDL